MSDEATQLKVSSARFYKAAVGTPIPADLRAPGAAWEDLGNTSLTDILSATSTGGESTTQGSLQNKSLRTTVTARVEAFKVNLMDFVIKSLKLYYGSNAVITAEGYVRVPNDPVPTEAAWMVVFYDGEFSAGIHADKASIFRNADLAIANADDLAQLPLTITPLSYNGQDFNITFIPPHKPADVVP